MEILLHTFEVWKLDAESPTKEFLRACSGILSSGDIAVFGAYEPTIELTQNLLHLGAKKHLEMKEFYSSFELNRYEHPNGCAFEYSLGENVFSDLLAIPENILRQKDIQCFYDHFLAYRPGTPRVPLISFHDAACGGTLYLSGLYSESTVRKFSEKISAEYSKVTNPIYSKNKN
tara:strand:- start:63 stop:584 length:522 start_codon:yes stop_codon:yes gene_type:complete